MSRRALWILGGMVLSLGLVGSWFLNTFERVPVPRRDAPQAEARQNPYLALERFLSRMGRSVARTTEADILHRLPAPGTLILDRGRAYHLTDLRQEALMRWVSGGGFLILVPETPNTPDPVADLFDLVWTSSLRGSEDGDDPLAEPQPTQPPRPSQRAVVVPGASRPLTVAFQDGLTALGEAPVWAATDPNHGAHVLHFAYGRGSVTVVAHLDALVSNDRIADYDHAELVSTLLERYQPTGAIVLLTRLGIPSLGEWLVAQAPLALWSAALLLIVWLWNVVPRFGPVVPEPSPDRRELREHLLAVGRFVRKQGGGQAWLTIVRSAVEGALVRRHPSYRPGVDNPVMLAARTGIPAADLIQAFTGDGTRADGLVTTMRALQRVERSL
jgi:hypothetical protein